MLAQQDGYVMSVGDSLPEMKQNAPETLSSALIATILAAASTPAPAVRQLLSALYRSCSCIGVLQEHSAHHDCAFPGVCCLQEADPVPEESAPCSSASSPSHQPSGHTVRAYVT